ncbi:MAG: hypothetical protein M3Q07_13415 [Pseudobdellovibrionaceae bacterium]|nr:hypothetical protein [Pseudobdellovibrionaceae bacterium]
MFKVKSFVDDIKALDKKLMKILPDNTSSNFEIYQEICNESWIKPIKELAETNRQAIEKDFDAAHQHIQKSYKNYISPLFAAYLSQLTYDTFPYPYHIPEKAYKAFIQKIRRAKTPDKMQEAIENFRKTQLEPSKEYMFRKLFRPYHPIHYLLEEIESAIDNTFVVDAERVIFGLCPYLRFPQNKNTKELQFALGFSAGISMLELMRIDEVTKINKWTIQYSTEKEKVKVQLLFKASEWIRAFTYLQSCQLIQKQARQSLTEIPQYMIEIAMSYKFIPAMYSALAEHFHGDRAAPAVKNTKTTITVTGNNDLNALIDTYQDVHNSLFQEKLAALPETVRDRALLMAKKVLEDPTLKVSIRTIKETADVQKVTAAQEINDLFWNVYKPLEQRPTRREKEKESED